MCSEYLDAGADVVVMGEGEVTMEELAAGRCAEKHLRSWKKFRA